MLDIFIYQDGIFHKFLNYLLIHTPSKPTHIKLLILLWYSLLAYILYGGSFSPF